MTITNTSSSSRPESVAAMRRRLPDRAQVALDAAEQKGHHVRIAPTQAPSGGAAARVDVYDGGPRFDAALVALLWRAGFRLSPASGTPRGPRYDHAVETFELA